MESAEKKAGEYVKRVRESAHMNQTEFAKFLGVKQSFLSAVERGVRKPPKSWGIVLSKEFGVSENYLESGVITSGIVLQNGTPSGTPVQKVEKRGTTTKKPKKSYSVAEFMARTFTQEEVAAGRIQREQMELSIKEEEQRIAHRPVTATRLYKQHPEAISEGLRECISLSSIGFDSDRIMGYLHSVTEQRIGEVLDRIADKSVSMAEAAIEVQAITAPLDEIKDYFTRIETAVVDMAAAAVGHFPEAREIIGYHIHESLFERSGDQFRRKVDDKLRARAASSGEGAELPG